MRTPALYVCVTLTALAVGVTACSASDDDSELGSTSQAVTAKGKASEGAQCLVAPVYRTDKCLPGLTCATSGNAARGVCVGPHQEAEACDPTYGSLGCKAGLTCSPTTSGSVTGFCKGAGTGVCRIANGGADCASGRACVESSPGSGTGSCQTTGTEGTPCDDTLVNNQCLAGFECVVPPGRGTQGICTNPSQGGIGAPCGVGIPRQHQCVAGTICAIAPELVGRRYEGSTVQFRCAAHAALGDQCIGVFENAATDLEGPTACQYYPCYPGDRSHIRDGSVAVGICSKPIGTTGKACGTHGVDDCGESSSMRLMCIDGSCVQANVGAQQACRAGRSPTGQSVSNCGLYNSKQMACASGTCRGY